MQAIWNLAKNMKGKLSTEPSPSDNIRFKTRRDISAGFALPAGQAVLPRTRPPGGKSSCFLLWSPAFYGIVHSV